MKSLRLCERQVLTLCKREESTTLSYLSQLNSLNENLTKEFEVNRHLVDELLSVNDDDDLLAAFTTVEEQFFNAQQRLVSCIDQIPGPSNTRSDPNISGLTDTLSNQTQLLNQLTNHLPSSHSSVKLPNILIPKFSGERKDWMNFRDLYESVIHDNESLSRVQKFQYLKTALFGEAASLICSISITENNYTTAWNTLINHYDKLYLVIRSVIEKMFNCESLNSNLNSGTASLLPTAIVLVQNTLNREFKIRVLLDTGAQASFITEHMIQLLGLKRDQTRAPIMCLSKTKPIYSHGKVTLSIGSCINDSSINVTAQILNDLIDSLLNEKFNITCLPELQSNFQLADRDFYIPSDIHMILNAPKLFEILKNDRWYNPIDKLYITDMIFGHIVCGNGDDTDNSSMAKLTTALISDSDNHLDSLLEQFWKIEEPPHVPKPLTIDEQKCEQIFKLTTTRMANGRFCVRLPFLENAPPLGLTYRNALKRFYNLERKFAYNGDFHSAYLEFMTEYESLGHMKRILPADLCLNPTKHYIIPHHGIWQREGNKTKLRVVFDASAKSSTGVALNEVLHSGPALQADLTSIITSFRLYPYVMSADIIKMYRQIIIHPDDIDYQLILWRDSPSQPISVYRLLTVTYGQSCSPFLALRSLQELFNLEGKAYSEASQIILNGRFVDNLFWGSNDIKSLKTVTEDLKKLLSLGGFELGKWVSNTPQCLDNIPRAKLIDPVFFNLQNETTNVKTLGICWFPLDDQFGFEINLNDIKECTKRTLLAETARLFDPLGWISPIILKLKLLIQETWVRQLDWDVRLPQDIVDEWTIIHSKMACLNSIKIPRWFGGETMEIHGFSDAN